MSAFSFLDKLTNQTNVVAEKEYAVRTFSHNKIRFSIDFLSTIKWTAEKKIYVGSIGSKVYVACTPSDSPKGRAINPKTREFTNANLSKLFGGENKLWITNGEVIKEGGQVVAWEIVSSEIEEGEEEAPEEVEREELEA